jgi:hypothetical protein
MIRWLWSRVMKWGWDYGRDIDDGLVPLARRKGRYDVVSLDDTDSTIELPDPITFRVQAIAGGTLVLMLRFLLILIGTFFISGCGSMCGTMTGTLSSSSSNDGSSRCITVRIPF